MNKDTTKGMEKIVSLFDSGTFSEVGAFRKRCDGKFTGVVCGYGSVNGKLTYAFAQDSDRQKGAFDVFGAAKICELYELALKNGAPVVGIFDSIGCYVSDGAGAMSAYGKLLATVSKASGAIPQIALVNGVCLGLTATVAAMFDLAVTVKGQTKWSVNAPFLIGKEAGSAENCAASGVSSAVAENETDAVAKVRELIDLLPANCEDTLSADVPTDDVNRTVAVDGLNGAELIKAVADNGKFFEIGENYGTELATGLIRMGGVPCGVIAGNGNAVTAEGAKKVAHAVGFFDSFKIPVITLVDNAGVAADEKGTAAYAAELGKLAMAYAAAQTAKITVEIGKAYGAAFTLLGSKALGADTVYALEDAKISVMAPESAVAFLWNDQITEEVTRASLEEKWNNEVAAPAMAAADGSIDDVIDSAELRQRICASVYMLMMKQKDAPARRHCNLPL